MYIASQVLVKAIREISIGLYGVALYGRSTHGLERAMTLNIDSRPNGDALQKCILKGPYTQTIVTTPSVPVTENSLAVPEQTTVKTIMNMTPENRAHFKSEKEAIHLILTGIRDEIYSTVDACQKATTRNNLTVATMQVNVQFLQQLQPEWSRFVTIIKQQHKLDEDDQNDVECDDERVALANLIANFKLDVDENKKIQKIVASCNFKNNKKQTEFERYKAFNDRTVEYDKLEHLKYVESLEDEIEELESEKAEFSNMYDMLLQECVSNDNMCSYLQSSSDLDEITELQFCKRKKASEEYFEKHEHLLLIFKDLKAQLQDKNIAISELKKLIDKRKGKSIDTKFDKPSVVRQPNAQRIPKPSVSGKPAPFLDSLGRTNFAKKSQDSKTNDCMYRIASSTTQTRAPQLTQTSRNTNPRVSTSTGVAHRTNVSRPQPRSNQMKDKVLPNTSQVKFKKTKVEDHPRISSISNQTKSVTACNDSLNSRTSNVNVVCATCGKCVFNLNHDACVSKFLNDVNARTKKPNVVPISTRKPKSQANKSVATPHKKTVASESTTTNSKSYYRMLYKKTSKAWKWWIAQQCPSAYKWVPKTKRKWVPKVQNESVNKKVSFAIDNIVQLILFIVDSGCTKHMTGNLSLLCNFVEKYLGTVRFGNDQFAPILGYGDLVQGNITIKRVYYVEGLNHNLFSVGQFCDADLEVAFRKSTCFVRDLQGNDLLTGNRGTDLYTISLQETTSSTPICLMAKASPTQAWLWHRRLSHLNFDYINLLSKKDVVIGLPKLKYVKDQLCSSCEVSKAKRSSFKSKTVPSSKGRLNLLHMDLCGPMRVASINGKKYILVIVDDYSRYTWILFLRSKDETPEVLKDFLMMIQRNLQAPVIFVRTDRGTEFLNKTLNAFFKEEGIEHQTSTPRTPKQNGIVKR
ncbi:retrovirus-related pol polyprotein from transposon TNT 1-94 [Tanacetum coccineum]